jgi:hypothetical protein
VAASGSDRAVERFSLRGLLLSWGQDRRTSRYARGGPRPELTRQTMAKRLFIVLVNTDPRNPEELGAPFHHAAAAMD